MPAQTQAKLHFRGTSDGKAGNKYKPHKAVAKSCEWGVVVGGLREEEGFKVTPGCHAFEKPLPPAKNKRRAGSGPPPNGELWANKCGQCIGGIFHMQMEATPG